MDVFGQDFKKINAVVTRGQDTLFNVMDGGMNAPQFQQIDVDGDGLDELIIFDRVGNIFLVYKFNTTKLRYEYVLNPPIEFPMFDDWVIFKDYDGDGIADIFANPLTGAFGFGIWKGKRVNGTIYYDRVELNQGEYNVLYAPGSSGGKLQIYCNNIDIPVVEDLDGDGDLDILTFNLGGTYLEMYINFSVEKGFGKDSLIYEKKDICYGKFYEDGGSNKITISQNSSTCGHSLIEEDPLELRHAGSSVLLKDIDKDGLKDILLGDVSAANINYLKNTGVNNVKSYITQVVTSFPMGPDSINLGAFPAVYALEFGSDKSDVLVASSNNGTLAFEQQLNWLYRYDENEVNQYKLVEKDFLMKNTFDSGLDFNPSFFDVDGDGLLDIIAGNKQSIEENKNQSSHLTYFKNTSVGDQISFEIKDENFADLMKFGIVHTGLKPCFTDIDNDGFMDMLVGTERGTLLHFKSLTPIGQHANFVFIKDSFQNIRVPSRATPFAYDVDKDGVTDFIIGDKNGNFTFYKNTGSVSNPSFEPNFQTAPNVYRYGNVSVKDVGDTEGDATPSVINLGGKEILISGSFNGRIYAFEGMNGNSDVQLTPFDLGASSVYSGKQNHPKFADLNNDGIIELVQGSLRGGMNILSTNIKTDGSLKTEKVIESLEAVVYPNPISTANQLNIKSKSKITYAAIIDLNGKIINTKIDPNGLSMLNVSNKLSPGVYILKLKDIKGLQKNFKIVVQ